MLFDQLKEKDAFASTESAIPLPAEDLFCTLYPRFIAGTVWLEAQANPTNRDKTDFYRQVINPMDEAWATLTQEARLRCCYKLKEYMPEELFRAITMFEAKVEVLR